MWLRKLHICLSKNIEINLGPKSNTCESFSVLRWTLSSISAHNFSTVSLLNAYTSLHSFQIIYLLETYLDASTLSPDSNLEV